jgi:hypothetical protein
VTSLVERVSRFAVLLRNNDRQSWPIMERLISVMRALPHRARRSITFDRGTEFTDWPYLQAGIGSQTWFCDPQSPWQKGTVENTNGRASHIGITGSAAAFGDRPGDVLGGVLDVAGLAVDAVLRVDHEARLGLRLGVLVDDLVDAGRAVEPRGLAIKRQVLLDRDRGVVSFRCAGWSSS